METPVCTRSSFTFSQFFYLFVWTMNTNKPLPTKMGNSQNTPVWKSSQSPPSSANSNSSRLAELNEIFGDENNLNPAVTRNQRVENQSRYGLLTPETTAARTKRVAAAAVAVAVAAAAEAEVPAAEVVAAELAPGPLEEAPN